jgi:PAS domain-containing protein
MNEGAAILGSDGTFLFCNARLSSMLDRPIENILGRSIFSFVTREDFPSFEALVRLGLNESQ